MRNILIVILLLIITSCSTTRYIDRPVTIETVRTEYINQLYRDSVFIHDSIDRYISGDTVYQYKYRYVYKYMNRTDTICKIDSIEIPIEVKTVEIKEINKLKWYQTILIYIGSISFLLILLKLGSILKNKN